MVTPWPSKKPNGDSSTVNSRGTQAGNCNFCHDSGIHTDGREIVYNLLSHHGAGYFQGYLGSGPCFWCHIDEGLEEAQKIRKCEGCHGIQSLHNIQVDSNAPANIGTIVPGQEYPYYGHIGSNDDCWGCHGFSSSSAAAPYSGPVVPYVADVSASSLTAGVSSTITVSGSAFTNIVQGPTGPIELKSNVVLTAANSSTTTITPIITTESSMDVTIPGTLAAGNYDLRAVKGPKASNLFVVSVKPTVVINSATCSSGVVTITGSGFSEYVNAVNSGTSVRLLGGSTCTVNSWSDTQIKANCGTCSGTVEVDSVFGTASKIVVDVTPPPPTCTSFTYSAWSACVNGQQFRTVLSSSPAGCVGGNPVLTQTCNLPPVANAGPDQSTKTNRTVKFDGSASKDPDGYITKYQWNFGDNSSTSGKVVYHKYTRRGTYTVTLTVTENQGVSATDTAAITVK